MMTKESKAQYLAAYQHAKSHAGMHAPTWLSELREAGITSFEAIGFPTLKHEDWKYTNVEPIAAQSFGHANGEARHVSASEIVAR
jgi:Fe-S cluster assembly protein SufD